jgi:hypothetical protein
MRNFFTAHDPSSRRKPGPNELVKRGSCRPVDSIQGIPAFAGMTFVRRDDDLRNGAGPSLATFTGDSHFHETGL